MEDTSFKRIPCDVCNSRYLKQMALKQELRSINLKAD